MLRVTMLNMDNELEAYLNSLARNDCFHVEKILKKSLTETTEIVNFIGANNSTLGPFIRKTIVQSSSLGTAYQRIWQAQKQGARFSYLPRIYDYYETEEHRIVIMEYLLGQTLEKVVENQDLTSFEILTIFSQICKAVCEIHERFNPPIIHRDLKPSNIMVHGETITLIDFGIARSVHEEAETDTQHFGTRSYAPPEQFGFSQTDQRSDEYALAALLFFCFTKNSPTSKDRENGFCHVAIPSEITTVIAKASSLDPNNRYENVRIFNEALQRAAAAANINTRSFAGNTNSIGNTPKKKNSRIFYLKTAWDCCIGIILLLFALVSISMTINPTGNSPVDAAPIGIRIASYGALFFLFFAPIGYLISAKEPLERLFKFYKRPKLITEIIVIFALIMLSLLIVGFLTNLT